MNARRKRSSEKKLVDTNVGHVLIFTVIFLFFAVLLQRYVVPTIVEGFVLSQFKPEEQELVDFQGVKATPSRAGLEHIGEEVRKQYINMEYLFDFTQEERTVDVHGYPKKGAKGFLAAIGLSGEWVVKAPALGDHAIYLEPYGFVIFSIDFAFLIAIFLTVILPSSIGYMARKVEREIINTKAKIRLQTGFSNEVIDILTLPDDDLLKVWEEQPSRVREVFRIVWDRTMPEEQHGQKVNFLKFEEGFEEGQENIVVFRNQILYGRIKEHFSAYVMQEVVDTKKGRMWEKNHFRFWSAIRLYMSHYFSEQYSNAVTGMAYGGAALLIVAVGIRGLKFIPAVRPSLIFFAILLEFTMLSLLAITMIFTLEEERADKMLKKLEDASKSQLDALEDVARDIHKLAVALEAGTQELIRHRVEQAISEYLASEDHLQRAVAQAIKEKIIVSLKEAPLTESES